MKHNKKPPKGSKKFAKTGKLATGSLLTGLVAMSSSCSSDMEPPCLDNSSDRIYGTHAANLSRGATFISLDSIALSDEFRAYVSVMSTTLQDILADQNIAYQFCQNPEGYLQNRFSGDPILSKMSMELSNADKNFLLATTDKVSTMYNELVVNRATEAVNLIGTEFPSVDKDALRDFFILNIGTSYGFKQ